MMLKPMLMVSLGLVLSIVIARTLLSQPASAPCVVPPYERTEWMTGWTDADRDCQNTRHEVLLAESLTPALMDERGCHVLGGTWQDAYSGETITNPRALDIDHLVPLANAHRSGGWQWTRAQKRAYAQELSHAEHLIAVSASLNRQKGDKGPEGWQPEINRCQYGLDWMAIKRRHGLTLSVDEAFAVMDLLAACQGGG